MDGPATEGTGGSRGGCRGGCRRPCRAAASATAAALALVVSVAAAIAALRAAAAGAAGALPVAVRAAAAAEAPPNASADPITAAWVAALRQRAAAALPPLPSADLFRRADGLFTLHAGTGLAAGQVLLEVGADQLDAPFAISAELSAADAAAAGLLRRVDLAFLSPDRVYAFRLAPGTVPPILQLYRPPLRARSVAPDSVPGRAAAAGISASTVQSFVARPVGGGRLLINAGPWVAAGFHLSGFGDGSTAVSFVGGAAHPTSVSWAVKVATAAGVGADLKVTALGLPRRRMAPRPLDDRIGYFAANFSWVDDYKGAKPAAVGASIYKWDLLKNPVLKYYVDPSVPRAFWPAVADGIRRWNPAFAAAGHERPVLRAVVPTDADWPADYAADDARFNTISFVPGGQTLALGFTKADPRTGEILNADIIFNDDLVRYFFTSYRLWYGGGSSRAGRGTSRAAAGVGADIGTRSAAATGGREPGSEADYVYQHVADTVAHEVGHTLGLRHNFRGSAGIEWSQLTNATFVAAHGMSTSVMDYLPLEPPPTAADGSPPRYFTSPVIGAYDMAAIRYGYTNWRSEGDARDYAESVAAAGLAFASDDDREGDALAQQRDHSATPLRWHRHNVAAVGRRLAALGRAAGRDPSTSAADLYADVESLVDSGLASVTLAAKLVGAALPDRRRTGGTPAVTPVDAATEAAAARWVLSQLHPETGLLSAATVAAVAPHVLAPPAGGCTGGDTCIGREAPPLAVGLARLRGAVLRTLLSPSRLNRLAANAAAMAAAGGDARRRLSVAGLLAAISETFFGARWADLVPPTKVTGGSLFRAEAQAGWVKALAALAAADSHPAAAAAAAAGELSRIAAAVAAAVAAAPGSTHLRGLRLATAAFVVA